MSIKFNVEWLKWAVKIEDEVDCDIEAGLNLGKYLGDYVAMSQDYQSEVLLQKLEEHLNSNQSITDTLNS
jgi:hypothetical protein